MELFDESLHEEEIINWDKGEGILMIILGSSRIIGLVNSLLLKRCARAV